MQFLRVEGEGEEQMTVVLESSWLSAPSSETTQLVLHIYHLTQVISSVVMTIMISSPWVLWFALSQSLLLYVAVAVMVIINVITALFDCDVHC